MWHAFVKGRFVRRSLLALTLVFSLRRSCSARERNSNPAKLPTFSVSMISSKRISLANNPIYYHLLLIYIYDKQLKDIEKEGSRSLHSLVRALRLSPSLLH